MPEKFLNFINSKKIYFIIIFSILSIAWFFYYGNNKPTSVAGMMREADKTAAKGQIAYAIEDYNKIVRVFPKNYEAHIRLAELYLHADEQDLAKVEYIKAIELGYKSESKANIDIANLYVEENNFTLAESFINEIKYIKDKKVQQLIGDFYYKWGIKLKKDGDKTEAIRKFKTSYKYYKLSESPNLLNLKKDIRDIYIDISNDLLNANKPVDSVNILKLSLSFWNNAETHYRLAKIYEKYGKIDNALAEYKMSFTLNPSVSGTDSYFSLLVKKAGISESQGDKITAELYYTLANKLKPKTNIQMNPDNRIILNNVEAKCNENIDKDILIPEISFKLSNISKDTINYLKIKINFLENNKPFSEQVQTLATEKQPLNKDSSTSQINIFSSKPVNYVLDKHNLLAQIYISQKTPDKWVLFRNVKIVWEIKSDVLFSK
ncbi:MAG: hypothetical protein WCG23_08625 [bacterium]